MKLGSLMKLLSEIWSATKRVRWASLVATVFFVAFVVVSFLIGMPPFGYVIIVGLIAAPSAWYLLRAVRAADAAGGAVSNGRMIAVFLAAVTGTAIVIQAIPYGWSHSNPPVLAEPNWAGDATSAQGQRTRELMVRACFGCHSNEVEYPSYSRIAPISWVVASHVDEGRESVNYSEFVVGRRGFGHTLEVIQNRSMPPGYYTRFGRHPEADLTDAEMKDLIAGLRATPGLSEGAGENGEDEEE